MLFMLFNVFLALSLFSQIKSSDPESYSSNNRILGIVLAYDFDHLESLVILLDNYLSLCEGGWSPTVVITTAQFVTDLTVRYLESKTYCFRTNSYLTLHFSIHSPNLGTNLASVHRKIVKQEFDNFDLFIYHEDDIIIHSSHVAGYLQETKALKQLSNGLQNLRKYMIGFQRYRKIRYRDLGHENKLTDQDAIEHEMLEEVPHFSPICIEDFPYLEVTGNKHQAMWMMTHEQIQILQEKCSFLDYSSPSREFMSSLSLFGEKDCNLIKLLPPDGLTKFSVNHYYQARHPEWVGLFNTDFSIQNTLEGKPECWEHFVKENIEKNKITRTNISKYNFD